MEEVVEESGCFVFGVETGEGCSEEAGSVEGLNWQESFELDFGVEEAKFGVFCLSFVREPDLCLEWEAVREA